MPKLDELNYDLAMNYIGKPFGTGIAEKGLGAYQDLKGANSDYYKKLQMDALAKMGGYAAEKADPVALAQQESALIDSSRAVSDADKNIMSNMQSRGLGTSGISVENQLAARQNVLGGLAGQMHDISGQSADRKMGEVVDYGKMASGVRGQEFDENYTRLAGMTGQQNLINEIRSSALGSLIGGGATVGTSLARNNMSSEINQSAPTKYQAPKQERSVSQASSRPAIKNRNTQIEAPTPYYSGTSRYADPRFDFLG